MRWVGSDVIGEMDKPNQKSYIATKRETAGAMLWIGKELKRLRANANATSFLPDITSVSRTVKYQSDLTKKNSTATKELSFHVLGLAFDFAKSSLNEEQTRDLLFILDELDSAGMISWVPEDKAYHVVVSPDEKAREFFIRVYNDNKEFKANSPMASQLISSK